MTAPKRQTSPHTRKSADVVSRVTPIADKLATIHGLVLWSVRFERTAGRDFLRVACDRVGGVGSDELALYADDLGRELDHTDAVPGKAGYVLEVTSPGAERKLDAPEHYRVCRGRVVRLSFKDGRPALDGVIGDAGTGGVDIETAEGTAHVAFEEIARAQLRVTEI